MIFISTTCLNNNKNLFQVLEKYAKLGITNIELGSAHDYIENFTSLFKWQKEYDFDFIIHGFFPPNKKPVWMNLASINKEILEISIWVVKNAIELCRKLDSNLYSFHGGYLYDFDMNHKQIGKELSKKEAYSLLKENIGEMCDYASQYSVNIAIENMNATLPQVLFNTSNEIKDFLKAVSRKNLGVLIDIGHLKLASQRLGFDPKQFIKMLQEKMFEIHVHENNGVEDDHLLLKDTKLLDIFDKGVIAKIPVTLESTKLSEKQLIEGKNFLDKAILNF